MSAYSDGLYVLTTWAAAGDSPAPDVRAKYEQTYGRAAVESLGLKSKGINFGSLQDAFRASIDQGASKLEPNLADINTPLLTISGKSPSTGELLAGVASDVQNKAVEIGNTALSFSKYILIAAIVLGVAYIAFQTGALRKTSAK